MPAAVDPYPGTVPDRPALRRLDPPMVPLALGGIATWAVAGLVLLAAGAPRDWLRTCLAGFLLGLMGLAVMHARDRRRRRADQGEGGTTSTSLSS